MTQNGGAQYTYDAESRLTSAGGVNYFYDGDGNRVEQSSGTLYWGSGPLAESDLNGTNWTDYIFFNGKRVARIDPNGSLHYYLSDHLGSTSVVTDASGNIQSESDYYPYGGEMPITSGDTNHYKFTGKERDTESGLDNFGARYDSSALGRFMTPDWADSPEPIPFAELRDPQSLNLYSYVRNNPISSDDPTGHECQQDANGNFKCTVKDYDFSEPQIAFKVPRPNFLELQFADNATGFGNGILRLGAVAGRVLDKVCAPKGAGCFGTPLMEFGGEGEILAAEGELLTGEGAEEFGILREAAQEKGNFGMGAADAATADKLGKAWVGDGATVASDGKTLVSKNGLRTYRPPSYKPSLGKMQANFERKAVRGGQPIANGHLDIK